MNLLEKLLEMKMFNKKIKRRQFLNRAIQTAGLSVMGSTLLPLSIGAHTQQGLPFFRDLSNLGPLLPANELGLRLPQGFSARVIAETGQSVKCDVGEHQDTGFYWHMFPDGGATFETDDGGWIYVSNSEIRYLGGVNAIRFDAEGRIVDAYSILKRTNRNCAGGPTPWKTWLSCEEVSGGYVFECDPWGNHRAIRRSALGRFNHEAVAVDPQTMDLYLTEDKKDGCLYRFQADYFNDEGFPDLSSGQLSVAELDAQGFVTWHLIENPTPGEDDTQTRHQVPQSSSFNGGEGIWHHEGVMYFTTKGDNRVWTLDLELAQIRCLYDEATSSSPILSGVDNVTVSSGGHVLVAEDGGDMQIVVLDQTGHPTPLLQIVGQDHSEITGPAFNPKGDRLYFSSQRGNSRLTNAGITYEVTGPFLAHA